MGKHFGRHVPSGATLGAQPRAAALDWRAARVFVEPRGRNRRLEVERLIEKVLRQRSRWYTPWRWHSPALTVVGGSTQRNLLRKLPRVHEKVEELAALRQLEHEQDDLLRGAILLRVYGAIVDVAEAHTVQVGGSIFSMERISRLRLCISRGEMFSASMILSATSSCVRMRPSLTLPATRAQCCSDFVVAHQSEAAIFRWRGGAGEGASRAILFCFLVRKVNKSQASLLAQF